MPYKICSVSAVVLSLGLAVSAQSPQTYSHATTDRLTHPETPMSPPPRNVVFTDPDFGSSLVRATDATTNFKYPNTFLTSNGTGVANAWSKDNSKFYVTGEGGRSFAFAFDPANMYVGSLPNASPGQGLLLPLREGATFSAVDPDLIYGTSDPDTLTIRSYRFSTAVSTPVIDTTTCGLQPAIVSGPSVVSDDDVSTSFDDSRFSISEGGRASGAHMFVVVYDKHLGCRWYNTQTGQISGQWGISGTASVTAPYLIRHAYLSRSGKYIVILVGWFGWYVWDIETLNVTPCANHTKGYECSGYLTLGFNSLVNSPGIGGDMQEAMRPLGSINTITQLVEPVPPDWGQISHFTWNDADAHDSTPVCATTHTYDGDNDIDRPFAREIFCVETDGLGSTIWRFAHNRASWVAPHYNTQPLGTVSPDGSFFLFTSNWEGQLGIGADGIPRSDVFILKLQ